jgi:hypothetical protein
MESSQLSPSDWDLLIERISAGRCTPFLGAGVAAGLLPLGEAVARDLATKYNYPFNDSGDLIKVSQYVAVGYDSRYPKERLADQLRNVRLPTPDLAPHEPHRLLAKLPLPLFLTTNYDGLLVQALDWRRKDPKREFCRWNDYLRELPASLPRRFEPTPASPLVFHLHGYVEQVESMVLTEDDYLEFLSNMIQRQDILPPGVKDALARNTLLFIGYRLSDWNFRVILRSLARLAVRSYAVMPAPAASSGSRERSRDYLSEYYGRMDIKMYWGTAADFMIELLARADGGFD